MGLIGDLGELPLADLVQMTSVGGKTGRLVIFDEEDAVAGVLMFRGGRLVGARSGELTAEKAFYALLGVRTGSFEFDPSAELEEDEVNLPTESLLIEGMRRLDEVYRCAGACRRRRSSATSAAGPRTRSRRACWATWARAPAPWGTSWTVSSSAGTPTSTMRSTRFAAWSPSRSCASRGPRLAGGADPHAGGPPQPELER